MLLVKRPTLLKALEVRLVRAVWRWQRRYVRRVARDVTDGAVCFWQYFGSPRRCGEETAVVEVAPPDDEAVAGVLHRLLRQAQCDFDDVRAEDDFEVLQQQAMQRPLALADARVDFLEKERAKDAVLAASELANRVQKRFGVEVHPRSIERTLLRRGKKPSECPGRSLADLREILRGDASALARRTRRSARQWQHGWAHGCFRFSRLRCWRGLLPRLFIGVHGYAASAFTLTTSDN